MMASSFLTSVGTRRAKGLSWGTRKLSSRCFARSSPICSNLLLLSAPKDEGFQRSVRDLPTQRAYQQIHKRSHSKRATPVQSATTLLEKTMLFYEIPVGALTTRDLHQASELVKAWVDDSNSLPESVHHCFEILRRVALEMERPGNDYILSTFHPMLLTTIRHWNKAWEVCPNQWTSKQVSIQLVKWRNLTRGSFKTPIEIHNLVLHAYWASKKEDGPRTAAAQVQGQVERLWKELDKKGDVEPAPNQQTLEIVARAWLEAKEMDKAISILALLAEMPPPQEEDFMIGELLERALEICAIKGDGPSADHVLQLLFDFHDNGWIGELPSTPHYNRVIMAWANAKDPEQSLGRAQELLIFLNTQGGPDNPSLQPDVETYQAMLCTYTQSGMVKEAQDLLLQLCQDYQKDPETCLIQPDTTCFHIVLKGWTTMTQQEDAQAGTHAEALFRQMWKLRLQGMDHLKTDAVAYTAVMQAFVGSNKAGEEAEKMFSGLLVQSQKYADDPDLRPTHDTYHALIRAWAVGSGDVDKAAQVLEVMYNEHLASPDTSPAPNTECFNTILHAYTESGEAIAGQEARRVLDQMWELDRTGDLQEVRPNRESYTSCILAWAQSGHADAGVKAGELLQEMLQKSEHTPGLKPTAATCNSVLAAWTDKDDYWKSKQLFATIPAQFRDVETYNWLLEVLAGSSNVTTAKGEISDSILTAMVLRDVQANPTTHRLAYECWNQDYHDSFGNDSEKSDHRMRVLEQYMGEAGTS